MVCNLTWVRWSKNAVGEFLFLKWVRRLSPASTYFWSHSVTYDFVVKFRILTTHLILFVPSPSRMDIDRSPHPHSWVSKLYIERIHGLELYKLTGLPIRFAPDSLIDLRQAKGREETSEVTRMMSAGAREGMIVRDLNLVRTMVRTIESKGKKLEVLDDLPPGLPLPSSVCSSERRNGKEYEFIRSRRYGRRYADDDLMFFFEISFVDLTSGQQQALLSYG